MVDRDSAAPARGPRVNIVVAMGENRAIGYEGDLPWRLPADLRRFRAITMGHPIVMGRRTHESIGRVLPGRTNIVISRRPDFTASDCETRTSLDAALASVHDVEDVMIVGGAALYREALPVTSRIYLTLVHASPRADTWFPEIAPHAWSERSRERHAADADNEFDYSFLVLDRSHDRR